MSDPTNILGAIVHELDAGRRAALCVIVATRGSTPQRAGAMLCVDENAQIAGTLGGGCTEADIRRRAHELMSRGGGGVFTFNLDQDVGAHDGLICGGHMDVAISVISTPDEAQVLRDAVDRVRAGQAATLPMRVNTDRGRVCASSVPMCSVVSVRCSAWAV